MLDAGVIYESLLALAYMMQRQFSLSLSRPFHDAMNQELH